MLIFLCNLAILKVLFASFNYEYWNRCPWYQHGESNTQNDNFIRSIRVTLSTLYQTAFTGSMMCMVMGLKITKSQLTQREIKKIIIVAAGQYFIDSLYSIGSYVPFFGKFTAIILNIFSAIMIVVFLREARISFAQVNLRYAIVTQS